MPSRFFRSSIAFCLFALAVQAGIGDVIVNTPPESIAHYGDATLGFLAMLFGLG